MYYHYLLNLHHHYRRHLREGYNMLTDDFVNTFPHLKSHVQLTDTEVRTSDDHADVRKDDALCPIVRAEMYRCKELSWRQLTGDLLTVFQCPVN